MFKHSVFICVFILNGVFGVDGDEVKSVSVMEGDFVTLNTDITQIQKDDQIMWKFGPQETRIAQIDKKSIDMYDSVKIFGDRLNLDSQTGSLTITNIRITHTGLYKLQIISKSGIKYKAFSVTVYASLFVPVIVRKSSSGRSSRSKCVLLCSVSNVRDASLSWYKGNRLLSRISVYDHKNKLCLPLEVEYQDTNTYRCVVSNPITNQTKHLNMDDVCQTSSGLSLSELKHPLVHVIVLLVWLILIL
nr:natural killer cell receptor 2B4-like isoform X2 [Misgurnus anguillicaudatus]